MQNIEFVNYMSKSMKVLTLSLGINFR